MSSRDRWVAKNPGADPVHRPLLTEAGDPAHGCECCDGEDICNCPHKELRAPCLLCGGPWPDCERAASQ